MAIEIVDFPIENGESFHGKMLVHQISKWSFPAENIIELGDVPARHGIKKPAVL